MNVFVLWHFKIGADTDWAEVSTTMHFKAIGIYTSAKNAQEAIARKRQEPGFKDWPDGFRVISYRLDE